MNKKEVEAYVTNLDNIIRLFTEENSNCGEFVSQISFLEKMRDNVKNMYEEWEDVHFTTKFPKQQEALVKAFDDYILELTENLGLMVEDLYITRDRFKKHIDDGTYEEEEKSEFNDIKEGLEESIESENVNTDFEQGMIWLRTFLKTGGYDIKIIKQECESDEPKA